MNNELIYVSVLMNISQLRTIIIVYAYLRYGKRWCQRPEIQKTGQKIFNLLLDYIVNSDGELFAELCVVSTWLYIRFLYTLQLTVMWLVKLKCVLINA